MALEDNGGPARGTAGEPGQVDPNITSTGQGTEATAGAAAVGGATPDGGPASAQGGGVQAPGSAPATPGAESDYMGVREALAAYGVDLRQQFQDDHAALQHLALAYRQAQQGSELARYGQEYLQHADEFQRYLAQRQAAAEQQRAQQQQWWKAPEYDPRWLSQITRDPTTGELKALPGQDPSVVSKYLAWTEHQRGFLERFAQDPMKAIGPGIEQVVRQMAGELIQQQLGGYTEQQRAAAFVTENSGWLHARDASGQLVRDQGGQPTLSDWGQRFLGYVQEAQKYGLRDVNSQQKYALGLVQRAFLLAREQGAAGQPASQAQAAAAGAVAAPDVNRQQKDNFLAKAAGRAPNASGSLPAQRGGAASSQNPSLTLAERLVRDLQANGYTLSSAVETRRR